MMKFLACLVAAVGRDRLVLAILWAVNVFANQDILVRNVKNVLLGSTAVTATNAHAMFEEQCQVENVRNNAHARCLQQVKSVKNALTVTSV